MNVILTLGTKSYIDNVLHCIASIRLFHDYPIYLITDIDKSEIPFDNVTTLSLMDFNIPNIHKDPADFIMMQKSYYIKRLIHMGYKVLYIDCDTLVLNPLDELFSFNNIALRDELPYSVILEPKFIEKLDKEDQITVLKHNFNFGVIYVPDKSHIGLLDAYGSMFTKYLTNQKSDRGDQFFFNLTAHLLDYNIQRLEKKYNHFSLMWDGPVSADTVICHFAGFKGDVYSEHINRYKDNILKLKLDAIRESL